MKKLFLLSLLSWQIAIGMECEYCPKQEWPLPAFYEMTLNTHFLSRTLYANKVLGWSQDKKDEELRKHVEGPFESKHQQVHEGMVIVSGGDPNSPKVSDIILFRPVLQNNVEYVKFLLDHGALANIRDVEGMTPLFNASTKEMAMLLVSKGGNLKATRSNGQTLLHYAISQHHNPQSVELIEYYLDNGADVNAQDESGSTLLHYLMNHVNWIFKTEKTKKILLKKARLILSKGVIITPDKGSRSPQKILAKYATQENYARRLLTMIQQERERRKR